MLNNLKNNLHWMFYILGLIVYTVFIFLDKDLFPVLVILLITLLYIWVMLSIWNEKYSTKHFLYTICCTGFIASTTILFINGLTQPVDIIFASDENGVYPNKTEYVNAVLNFHVFAKVFGLFFLFSIPIIIYKYGLTKDLNVSFNTHRSQPAMAQPSSKTLINEQGTQQEWVEATAEDIESGNYEPI